MVRMNFRRKWDFSDPNILLSRDDFDDPDKQVRAAIDHLVAGLILDPDSEIVAALGGVASGGGGTAGLTSVDNGDGTATLSASGADAVTDNNDGTATVVSTLITDNADGTALVAA